jgi:hypothetical protein
MLHISCDLIRNNLETETDQWQPEGNGPSGRILCKWKIILRMMWRKRACVRAVDKLGHDTVKWRELMYTVIKLTQGSVKGAEFPEQLDYYCLLKKNSIPRSCNLWKIIPADLLASGFDLPTVCKAVGYAKCDTVSCATKNCQYENVYEWPDRSWPEALAVSSKARQYNRSMQTPPDVATSHVWIKKTY